jgi:methionyl-tRNA formyltransferase
VRVTFFGTPLAAVPALDALVDAGHEVALVVTQPDRPAGRGRSVLPPPVRERAVERGLSIVQPSGVRGPEFLEQLRAAAPEALVVVAYGRILPKAVLDVAPRGAINLHFSLLPAYRGAAPVQWSLARGETRTGATTMRMNERMDEGPILLQETVAIEEGEHAPQLTMRLARIGARLLVATLEGLARGEIAPREQEPEGVSLAPLLDRSDGWVDPALPARAIEGRIRGFDPWPGAWVSCRGRSLRWVEGVALDSTPHSAAPGTVLAVSAAGIEIGCGDGSVLRVSAVQPEGGRVLSARDAVNGRRIGVGDRVERILVG